MSDESVDKEAQGLEEALSRLSEDEMTALAEELSIRELRLVPHYVQVEATESGDSAPPAGFEYSGHLFIGDDVKLWFPENETYLAKDKPLTLENGLSLTYGQISALAGDFFATTYPISNPEKPQDRISRFIDAWNTLGKSKAANDKSSRILALLQDEVDAVSKAHREGKDPQTEVWPNIKPIEKRMKFWDKKGYATLAFYNWDHFGDDARKAYTAGHSWALEKAGKGLMEQAYAINAFADHYLQDLFSAGHMRTPRRYLHNNLVEAGISLFDPPKDMCSKMMHDEDCALGLDIANRLGETWTAFGDKRLLSDVNQTNLDKCNKAIEQSVKEVKDAYKSEQNAQIPPEKFGALAMAPTRESADAETSQYTVPLFRPGAKERRIDINDRKRHEFITNYDASKTLKECSASPLWKQPIH